MGGSVPGEGKGDAGDHETGTEAEPETYGSLMEAEGEGATDRKPDDPEADDLDDEAGMSVPGAAQRSVGGDLETIEELEESSDK